jgi:hypothetical protein
LSPKLGFARFKAFCRRNIIIIIIITFNSVHRWIFRKWKASRDFVVQLTVGLEMHNCAAHKKTGNAVWEKNKEGRSRIWDELQDRWWDVDPVEEQRAHRYVSLGIIDSRRRARWSMHGY